MIRCATANDAQGVRELLEITRFNLAHSADLTANTMKAERHLAAMACNPAWHFQVMERGGRIVGAFAGMVMPIWWADEEVAMDLFYCVLPEHEGRGVRMLRDFIDWAKGFDAVRRIIVSNSSSDERVNILYQRLGFKPNDAATFVMETNT